MCVCVCMYVRYINEAALDTERERDIQVHMLMKIFQQCGTPNEEPWHTYIYTYIHTYRCTCL